MSKKLLNDEKLFNVNGGTDSNDECACPKGYKELCANCFRAECGNQEKESLVPGKVKIKCEVYDKAILYNFVDKIIMKTYN